jgi:hypothetical protein
MQIKILYEIRVRFNCNGERTDSLERYISIVYNHRGIHVIMDLRYHLTLRHHGTHEHTWDVHLTWFKESFQHCSCVLCTPWRVIAPANAAVVVGLPLVRGGAFAATLAATLARDSRESLRKLLPSKALICW